MSKSNRSQGSGPSILELVWAKLKGIISGLIVLVIIISVIWVIFALANSE